MCVCMFLGVCVFLLPGSSRAAAGSEGGHGTAGEEQNSTLHPVHTSLNGKLPKWHQCESGPSQVNFIRQRYNVSYCSHYPGILVECESLNYILKSVSKALRPLTFVCNKCVRVSRLKALSLRIWRRFQRWKTRCINSLYCITPALPWWRTSLRAPTCIQRSEPSHVLQRYAPH